MKNVWLLLLVAGLVAGFALVGFNYYNSSSLSSGTQNAPEIKPSQNDNTSAKINGKQEEAIPLRPEEGPDAIAEIKNIDFKVDVRSDGEKYVTRFRVRNPGSESEDIRIDTERDDGAEMTIILRGSTDEGWVKDYSSNNWTHFTGIAFTQWWRTRSDRYLAYKIGSWKEMEGREFTVENEEGSGRVYDIKIVRKIPNSVFTPD